MQTVHSPTMKFKPSPVARRAAARAAAVEAPARTLAAAKLGKPYHGPHAVPETGIDRIVDMLRTGDLFRYGGSDEGSLQVRGNQAANATRPACVAALARGARARRNEPRVPSLHYDLNRLLERAA